MRTDIRSPARCPTRNRTVAVVRQTYNIIQHNILYRHIIYLYNDAIYIPIVATESYIITL